MEFKTEVGDLVFCHAIGSKYGWYLNQVGLITDIKKIGNKKSEFVVWLFGAGCYQTAETGDFQEKNLEVISRASGDNTGLKLPQIIEFPKLGQNESMHGYGLKK